MGARARGGETVRSATEKELFINGTPTFFLTPEPLAK
jgi:hypothetical protein